MASTRTCADEGANAGVPRTLQDLGTVLAIGDSGQNLTKTGFAYAKMRTCVPYLGQLHDCACLGRYLSGVGVAITTNDLSVIAHTGHITVTYLET